MKRVISLLLAVVLCVGMLPTTAFAGGSTGDKTEVVNGDGKVPSGQSPAPYSEHTGVGWCLTVQKLGTVDIMSFVTGDKENNGALASSMLRDLSDYPKVEKNNDYTHAAFVLPPYKTTYAKRVVTGKQTGVSITPIPMSSSDPSTASFAARCEAVFNKILEATKGGNMPNQIDLSGVLSASSAKSIVSDMMGRNMRDRDGAAIKPSNAYSAYISSLTDTEGTRLTAGVKSYIAQLVWAYTVEQATGDPREAVLQDITDTISNMFKGTGTVSLYGVSASVTVSTHCFWWDAYADSSTWDPNGTSAITAITGGRAFYNYALTDVATAEFSPSKTDLMKIIDAGKQMGGLSALHGTRDGGHVYPRGATYGPDNTAGTLVSSAAKVHSILTSIFGFETGTASASGDPKNYYVSYEGHTYGSNLGFFWYIDGLSGQMLPPPPSVEITPERGNVPSPAMKGGVKVVTPPVFTESSPVSTQVECEWTLDFNPSGMYLGEDQLFHEGNPYTFAKMLVAMRNAMALSQDTNYNQGLLDSFNTSLAGKYTATLPSDLQTINKYELKDDSIHIRSWLYLKATTTMTPEEGGELISMSQGYWGPGSGANAATSTYLYNTVGGYDPTTNPLDLKARNPDHAPVLSIEMAAEVGAAVSNFFQGSVRADVTGNRLDIYVVPSQFDKFMSILEENNWSMSVRTTTDIQGIEVDVENGESVLTWAICGWYGEVKDMPIIDSYKMSVEINEPTPNGTVPVTYAQYGFLQVRTEPVGTLTFNDYKLDYHAVGGVNPEHPTYHSVVDPYPHSEFNQGDVKQNATSPTRKFNSMTGTPTFTATEREELMNSEYYGKDGHYYQYFAVGGSEFVVEFDGKFHSNETATRTYTWNFASGGVCSESTLPCDNDQHNCVYAGDPPSHVGACCSVSTHMAAHPHIIGAVTTSFTVTYTGLTYVEIENAHVYQLVEGLLEGTYDLLDTDEVRAEIKSNAPGISVNIAGGNTAAGGRLVYKYESTQLDHVQYNYTLPSTCGEDGPFMKEKMDADIAKIEHGAYCVSDFIVLHTSAGNMSVLYHEYKDLKYSDPFSGSSSASSSVPGVGTISGSASVTCNNADQGFEVLTYEDVWKSNPWTSEGAGFIPEGVTYGGFNGKPLNLSTTYKSTHQNSINMSWSEWTKTQAYQNKSGVYGARGDNSYLLKTQPSKSLRLMANGLVIPDYKQNGDYDFTRTQVFYKELVDFEKSGGNFPNVYSAAAQSDFNNQSGFTMVAGYAQGSAYDNVANSVVVYNPISNQNAIVVSLPEERDQRTEAADVVQPLPEYGCPGITCEFSELVCNNLTGHLHGPSCYSVTERTVHGPANIHVHNLKDPETGVQLCYCEQLPATCDCSHCGNPACPGYCANHRYPCSPSCTISSGTGGTWSCNNLPLNAHDCNATGTPSTPQDQTINKSISYAASGTDVYSFTAAGAGYVNFYSTSYNKDPRGRVYVNGALMVDNDDGGGSLNFNTGNVSFNAGDVIRLNVYQYGSTGGCTAEVTIVIHYNSTPSSGGGGGPSVPPGAQYGTWQSVWQYERDTGRGYKCRLDG